MATSKKNKPKKTGSVESLEKRRDKAFQSMLDALESDDAKEYKKQYGVYRRLSADVSAAKGNTYDETLNMEMLKNRKRFSGGGLVRSGHTDHRKKGLFR